MLRIVPWSCRDEWIETYHNLYNFENIEQQVKGLERVKVWQSRSGSKLPLAVDATASIITAGVEDVKAIVSPSVVRYTMAMVIVRFVNGMVDMEQKGVYARSVQSIAEEIGLPDWLVDLRHEATHASLPSLEVLRVGCKFALNWLRESYWESQIAEFSKRDETMAAMVEKYGKLFGSDKVDIKTKDVCKKKLAKEIAALVSEFNMWQSFMELSFQDEKGLLVPSLKTLQEVFPNFACNKTTESSFELPKNIRLWLTPLLKALHKVNGHFLSNFVSILMKKLHELEQQHKNDLLTHFYSILTYFILSNCSKTNTKEKQWKITMDLDYLTLLEVCLQNPSNNNQSFLKVIIDNLEISSESLKKKLLKFSSFKFVRNEENNSENLARHQKGNLKTLKQQFPLVARRIEQYNSTEQEQDNSCWQKCSSTFPNLHKFGAFIGEVAQENEYINGTTNESIDVEQDYEQTDSIEQGISVHDSGEIDLNERSNESFSERSNESFSDTKQLSDEMITNISKNISIF